jgi:AcrR family transcriptional regulator
MITRSWRQVKSSAHKYWPVLSSPAYSGPVEAKRTVSNARQRVRAAVTADIVAEARRQLAEVGADALSLRAVARELGMASSAMYRYFTSRDELLTALIVEAYDSLGEAAETAATTSEKGLLRWQAVCRAVRAWAIAHPHEYALIYGSPVPGYVAPEVTLAPGSRIGLLLGRLLADAQRAGELDPPEIPALPRAVAAEVRPLAQIAMPGVPLPVAAQGLLAWTQLFGQINFELFGRFDGLLEDPEVLFEYAVVAMTRQVGLAPIRAGRSA